MKSKKMKRLLAWIVTMTLVFGMSANGVLAAVTTSGIVLPTESTISEVSGNSIGFQELDPNKTNITLNGGNGQVEVGAVDTGTPYESDDVVPVIIVFDFDSLDMTDTMTMIEDSGEEASSETVTDHRKELANTQDIVTQWISGELGVNLEVTSHLTLILNAITTDIKYDLIDDVEELPYVAGVYIDEEIDSDESLAGEKDGDESIVAQITTGVSTAKSEYGYTGAGLRIAICDSGVNANHQSFDGGAFEYSLGQLYKDNTKLREEYTDADEYMESLNLLDETGVENLLSSLNADVRAVDDVYSSLKIPFVYDYTGDGEISSSHGGHVAGIAAANSYIPAEDAENGYADAQTTVGVVGAAPDAQLIAMQVSKTSEYAQAFEDAILLGCDAINLSRGRASGPANYREDGASAFDLAVQNLVKYGVILTGSAGNYYNYASYDYAIGGGSGRMYTDEGGTYTTGSPASFKDSFSVANAANRGKVSTTGGQTATNGVKNVELSLKTPSSKYNVASWGTLADETESKEYDLVFLGDPTTNDWLFQESLTEPYCEDEAVYAIGDLSGYDLKDKVVLVARGNSATSTGVNFASKYNSMLEAEAAGIIYYYLVPGQTPGNPGMTGITGTDMPAGSISLDCAREIYDLCSINESNGKKVISCKIKVTDGLTFIVQDGTSTMQASSSWGVPGSLTMKPEITAPGGNIYNIFQGEDGLTNDAYDYKSGTSMSAPFASAASLLVKQYLRDNDSSVLETAREVSGDEDLDDRELTISLLMSTAEPLPDPAGDYEYPVRLQGSGLLNVSNVLDAETFVLMDDREDGKVKAELGDGTDERNISFTVYNLTDEEQIYKVDTSILTTGTETNPNTGDSKLVSEQMIELDADVSIRANGSDIKTVVVPAGGTAQVEVSIAPTEAALAEREANGYVNGFYLEGYIYLNAEDTGIGDESGTSVSHSIPFLGWYGNWSDPSMYDVGTGAEYWYAENGGEEAARRPHVKTGKGTLYKRNSLIVSDTDDEDAAWYYYGNPYNNGDGDNDLRYIPARNAMNSTSDAKWTVESLYATLIRTTIAQKVMVTSTGASEPLYDEILNKSAASAYIRGSYYSSSSISEISKTANIGYTYVGENVLNEGDDVTFSLICATEYYENEETDETSQVTQDSVRWDELGDGASLSFTFRVDNSAPEVLDVSMSDEGDLVLNVKDNNYIAYIEVQDADGNELGHVYPDMDEDQRGETAEITMDVDGYTGELIIAVCDYASNERYYETFSHIPSKEWLMENYGDGAVKVTCEAGTVTLTGTYDLEEGNFAIGRIAETDDEYTVTVTVWADEYIKAFNEDLNVNLAASEENESRTFVLTWDAENSIWICDDEAPYVEFVLEYESESTDEPVVTIVPEKPEFSYLQELFGDNAVTVECASASNAQDINAHEEIAYKLVKGSYSLGEVYGNGEDAYGLLMTIDSSKYIDRYNATYSGHIPYGTSQHQIVLSYNDVEDKWEIDSNVISPLTFEMAHKPASVPKSLSVETASNALELSLEISCCSDEEHVKAITESSDENMLIESSLEIGELYMNAEGGLCRDVTVKAAPYIKKYVENAEEHLVLSMIEEPVITFVYDTEEGWIPMESGSCLLRVELYCIPKAPEKVGELNNILEEIWVICTNEDVEHTGECYDLIENSYDISEVFGNVKNGFTVTVTLYGEKYAKKYAKDHKDYASHELAEECESLSLELKYENGEWNISDGSTVSFELICETPVEVEKAPEQPEDINAILGELSEKAVLVSCVNEEHGKQYYGLIDGYYSIGKVKGDAENGYSVKVTVLGAGYVSEYSDIYGIHALNGESKGSFTLAYEDGEWKVDSKLPVMFQAYCEKDEENPTDNGSSDDDRDDDRHSSASGSSDGRGTSVSSYAWVQERENDDTTWKLLTSDGTYVAGAVVMDAEGNAVEQIKWVSVNGAMYAFGADGYADDGWVLDRLTGIWYYVDINTGLRTGWHEDLYDRQVYYLNANTGAMLTGWQQIDGKWYYFNETAAGQTWFYNEELGKWLYSQNEVRPYGSMFRNEYTPDGYYVDANGIRTAR